MQKQSVAKVIHDLKLLQNHQKAEILQRFFKTGKGQYAEGDVFWGLTVPLVRGVARKHKDVSLNDLNELLTDNVHEVRLCALLIMVLQAKNNPKQIFDLYLKKTSFINNWDLVDLSAPTVVGNFLLDKDCAILYALAQSPLLWERRIAMVASYAFIKQGSHEHTLKLAQILMNDRHDLIHKAVGWMLREVGKRCSLTALENFLDVHAATMPRTMLRYAIERLAPERKKYFMQVKFQVPKINLCEPSG